MRQPLAEEAIRLARLLLRLYPGRARDHGPHGPHAAAAFPGSARFDAEGALVLLDDQDRRLWNRP
jgi:Predicted RNA polymerase sigma factor containing a TPR repeat domain